MLRTRLGFSYIKNIIHGVPNSSRVMSTGDPDVLQSNSIGVHRSGNAVRYDCGGFGSNQRGDWWNIVVIVRIVEDYGSNRGVCGR